MYAACMEKIRTAAEQPVLVFVFTFLGALLYLLYLMFNAQLIISMHTGAHPTVMTATQALPQLDFARFWYVGKEMLIRRLAALGYIYQTTPWFRATFQLDILSAAKNPAMVWLYPPTMAVLGTIFSFVPLSASFWLWNIATVAVAAICLRKAGLRWAVIAMGLCGPAEIPNFILGQNGALTAGFLVAGLMSFDRRPVFGGGIVGLLCIKPQIGLALPMILLRWRYRKALFCCLAAVALMILLSVLVEGSQAWIWFITVAEPNTTLILNAPQPKKIMLGGITVLMMARSLHCSLTLAWGLQIVSSAASAFVIWRLWRGPNNDATSRMAITVCLSLLLTPYGVLYDLVGFSVAMAAMFERSPAGQKPVYALLWLLSVYYGFILIYIGVLLMPIIALFAAWMIWNTQLALDSSQRT